MSIWADEWDATDDWSGGGAKSKRLVKKITAQARTHSQTGERLWMIHDVETDPDSSNA